MALNDPYSNRSIIKIKFTSFHEDNDEHILPHHVQRRIKLMVLDFVRVNEEAF